VGGRESTTHQPIVFVIGIGIDAMKQNEHEHD